MDAQLPNRSQLNAFLPQLSCSDTLVTLAVKVQKLQPEFKE